MSNIAQSQLRYHTVDTKTTLKGYTNAYAGDMALVLENKTLYQYVEYPVGITLPVDNNESILATTNTDLLTRWVAIDTYTSKAVTGTFTTSSWGSRTANDTYELVVNFVNPVDDFICKVTNSVGTEVKLQDIVSVKVSNQITSAKLIVGAVPDCRFEGSYFILKGRHL